MSSEAKKSVRFSRRRSRALIRNPRNAIDEAYLNVYHEVEPRQLYSAGRMGTGYVGRVAKDREFANRNAQLFDEIDSAIDKIEIMIQELKDLLTLRSHGIPNGARNSDRNIRRQIAKLEQLLEDVQDTGKGYRLAANGYMTQGQSRSILRANVREMIETVQEYWSEFGSRYQGTSNSNSEDSDRAMAAFHQQMFGPASASSAAAAPTVGTNGHDGITEVDNDGNEIGEPAAKRQRTRGGRRRTKRRTKRSRQ
jgi:hypothetical protein